MLFRSVFLKLKGTSSGTQPVPVHLYRWVAVTDEAALKTGQFPFRKNEMPDSEEPALSVVGLGKELQWVGGFTVEPGAQETCVEITQAVARAKGAPLNLVLARDRRQAGEKPEADPVEWQGAELILYPR